MKTETITTNCKVRLEWRRDGIIRARTTDLADIRTWEPNPYTGSERHTGTAFTFFTPAGEWIWADGKLSTPPIEGDFGDHWISVETLPEAIELVAKSLAGMSTREIYERA
jgi:hypothetical protein